MRRAATVAAVLLAMATTGCVAPRVAGSQFEPEGTNGFRYTARTAILADREDDPAAERTRMTWLREWLTLNKLCPNGYRILSRQPVLLQDTLGPIYDIRYKGECQP